jgi:hypothetical protein
MDTSKQNMALMQRFGSILHRALPFYSLIKKINQNNQAADSLLRLEKSFSRRWSSF